MNRVEARAQRPQQESVTPPGRGARALGRTLATLAVAVALTLWCAAEAIYPAGGWIGPQGDPRVIALAAVMLVAAAASGLAGLAFCAMAGGALVCLWMDAPFAARALAAVSVAALGYAVWQHRAAMLRPAAPWVVAIAAAATPLGLWLAIHVDAAIYAAGLGAFLTAYVLYAFARGSAVGHGRVAPRSLRSRLSKLPEQVVAVSTLLAVMGVGLIARVM